MIDRESAWCLLTEFTQSESLRKHALAVEACMRACARKYGGSGEKIMWDSRPRLSGGTKLRWGFGPSGNV